MPLNPNKKSMIAWDLLYLLTMTFFVLYIPLEVSLTVSLHDYLSMRIILGFLIFILVLDAILNFNRAFIKEGIMQFNQNKIIWNYL